jgi:malate synthase
VWPEPDTDWSSAVTTTAQSASGIEIVGQTPADAAHVLTPEALEFVARLHRQFNPTRERLLKARTERQAALDRGQRPTLLPETADIRSREWQVVPVPATLRERHVEITGPVERKMMINALNSGASCFMADFEDSLSPTWANVVRGQANLIDTIRGTISFASPDGRTYRLAQRIATLLVRPRGWHLVEAHVLINGRPVSASLFDFGLYVFHNARELAARQHGPFLYLPKLESHLEARLWNEVFVAAQDALGITQGTIRATVLVETILAAFEMEEILYELRDHSGGLNAGRWDYIFSIIKKFRSDPRFVLPDRAQVTMRVPFMRAYAERLVDTCHRRGAQAIGGMAAFIPSRRDEAINKAALEKVREDKDREAGQGFDGTWVAHPDLVAVAREAFEGGQSAHGAKQTRQPLAPIEALLDVTVQGGSVTTTGVRTNVRVAVEYLADWLAGSGAVGIDNLMEDTATAEISRAQLWQWLHCQVPVDGKAPMTRQSYSQLRSDVLHDLETRPGTGLRWRDAASLLDELVLAESFIDFLTLPGQRLLEAHRS